MIIIHNDIYEYNDESELLILKNKVQKTLLVPEMLMFLPESLQQRVKIWFTLDII